MFPARGSRGVRRRARPASVSTLPTTPCAGPRPRKVLPYSRWVQHPSASRVRQSASALSVTASRQRSAPVHSASARAARSVPGTPHIRSFASLSTFVFTRSSSACSRSPSGASRHATRRIPVSPVRRAGSGVEGRAKPPMKSGSLRNAASVRAAAAARSMRVSAWPRRRSTSSAQTTPAAPTYRFFIGRAACQPSHSSAGQSPSALKASSTSVTIRRIAARTRCSCQRVSVSGSNASGR